MYELVLLRFYFVILLEKGIEQQVPIRVPIFVSLVLEEVLCLVSEGADLAVLDEHLRILIVVTTRDEVDEQVESVVADDQPVLAHQLERLLCNFL